MPRRARIAVAGIPWHIIHRGNNRGICFRCNDDYSYYLSTLARQASKFDCQVHAYVLMTNHVHLLLTPGSKSSAHLLMKNVAQRHSQYINRTYDRTGTLWEGRYKSCLTREDAYVLRCYRYIELNPVRAGMVMLPDAYPWSSYGSNGGGLINHLITPHPYYLALGSSLHERLEAYRALLRAQLPELDMQMIRQATNANLALGSPHFQVEIETMLDRRATPAKRGRPRTNQHSAKN